MSPDLRLPACVALIRLGFTELAVGQVFAHTMTLNAASRRVMEKCGLKFVDTIPYDGPFEIEGAELGQVEYALTRVEWETRTSDDNGR